MSRYQIENGLMDAMKKQVKEDYITNSTTWTAWNLLQQKVINIFKIYIANETTIQLKINYIVNCVKCIVFYSLHWLVYQHCSIFNKLI